METVPPKRRLSTAQLRKATTEGALAQAQIGIAVMRLLGTQNSLTAEEREEMSAKVEEAVNDLIKIANQLLDAVDGD